MLGSVIMNMPLSRHWDKTTNGKVLTNSLTWVVTQHGTAVWARQVAGVEMSNSGLWRLRSRNWQLLVSQVNTYGSSSFCAEGGNPLYLPPTILHKNPPKSKSDQIWSPDLFPGAREQTNHDQDQRTEQNRSRWGEFSSCSWAMIQDNSISADRTRWCRALNICAGVALMESRRHAVDPSTPYFAGFSKLAAEWAPLRLVCLTQRTAWWHQRERRPHRNQSLPQFWVGRGGGRGQWKSIKGIWGQRMEEG